MYDESLWSLENIETEICAILAEATERPQESIRPDAPLDEGLGFDSLAVIQSHVAIEARFGVVMPGIELESDLQLATVKDLARSVQEQIRSGGHVG